MKNHTVIWLAFGALLLSACAQTKEQFDFSKKPPDEFQVTTRAPLEMPPDFNLRPPRPGTPRPQEESPVNEAAAAVLGQPKAKAETVSAGEAILLQKGGANAIDPNIRDKVDAETATLVDENTSTFNKILGRAGKKVDAPADVIDPVKESERIMQRQSGDAPAQ